MSKTILFNCILKKLEEGGFISLNDKAEELGKNLTKLENLYVLKLLIEDLKNKFSSQILIDLLKALTDHTSFDHHSPEIVVRLELHLRTFAAVLERICFSLIVFGKEIRDKAYKSLAKFAEFHRKTTYVISEGLENNFRLVQFNPSQDKNDENVFQKRNYNIDFLLIHLRDTLHSLRDDETWIREMLRRVKECIKAALNAPTSVSEIPKGIPSILAHLRQGLSFKYPIASYYVGWRTMLIIQYNLCNLSKKSEISKKMEEMALIEYYWGNLEIEWTNVVDSQSKFDEVLNELVEVLRNTGSFFNDLVENEPLALPHTLWFGILDLAQSYIQKSTRKATYGLCYYLAIESLNKAPSSFIQFKAIEILLHLYNINNELFSMIKIDFDQHTQKLSENKSIESSVKFQNLLEFVKEKCLEDFAQLNIDFILPDNDKKGKGKGKEKCLQKEQKQILKEIADGMADPISYEPTDQLCILKCKHEISLNDLKRLKKCPICREEIKDNEVKYLSQITIHKNLHQKFVEANLQSEDLDQIKNNQYDSDDSDNSEVEQILTKKKKFINAIKLNSRVSISSVFPTISKKQHPIYQNILKELDEKHYEKAECLCKEFLNFYPKSYSLRCILAYIYRCIINYKQAHLYLNEAIDLRQKEPIAYFIRGEICFRQNLYNTATSALIKSEECKAKINNLYVILGNSYLFSTEYEENYYMKSDIRVTALDKFKIALQNDPNNYLCLKNCAYIYEKQKKYLNTLEMLDKLLSINKKDSLILCYYGEILRKLRRYNESIIYFTQAYEVDPENIPILINKIITYYILQKYDEALLEINKVIRLNSSNSIAYCYKGLIYYLTEDINNSIIAFKKCIELDPINDLAKMQLYYLKIFTGKNNSINENNSIIKEISKISKTKNDKSLLFIRCKIHIELRRYSAAKLDLDRLFELDNEDISFVYLLRKYLDFWLYLSEVCKINDANFIKLGIVDKFNIYMFEGMYFFYVIILLLIKS
jgi:tetratricopeptide (TPR) repeat protein